MKSINIKRPSIGLQNNTSGLENHGVLPAGHLDCSLIPRNTSFTEAKSSVGIGLPQLQGARSRPISKGLFLCANSPSYGGEFGGHSCSPFPCSGKTNPDSLPPIDWSRCVAVKQPKYKEPAMSINDTRPPAQYIFICTTVSPAIRRTLHNHDLLSQYDEVTRRAISRALMSLKKWQGVVVEKFLEPSQIPPRWFLAHRSVSGCVRLGVRGVAA